jgi:hopanoid biosynthesis associated radical SAM protein HpnH
MWTVARYVLGKKLRGESKFPLVLMLEPLLKCNLACAGCGKIQHPPEILKKCLSPQQCFDAVEECGAPMVSIPGGEPLLHPEMEEIVSGLVERRKFISLCTNALLLKERLDRFTPSKYLSFSVHLDGPREEHDRAVCREGVYDIAVEAIRAAVDAGFRVTTNTTLFNNTDPDRFPDFFDELMRLGVEGMMVSPGYPYEKAPDQEHFLHARQTRRLFARLFEKPRRTWRFNQSPLFMEFLRGNWQLECQPWGMPTYNVFGWQRPCYLLDEGYCETFQELIETTEWNRYGRSSGNPACTDCMVHCGYEAAAVCETFGSVSGLLATARATLFGLPAPPTEPETEWEPAPHLPPNAELLQLQMPSSRDTPAA